MIKGYIAMTGDILHSGHIIALVKCKEQCSHLTVGVMTDRCVEKYKGQKPIIPYVDRAVMLLALRGVDEVIPQDAFNFPGDVHLDYDIVFDNEEYNRMGADVLIPYTKGISSTKIKERIIDTYNSKCKKNGWTKRKR